MKTDWNEVRLGEVISYRKQFITIDDEQTYSLCRVQTNAKGVVLRERKSGFEIKTKTQQVCRTGDFIVAEMDARFGGYGLVPSELDGAIVSSHYFLYETDDEKIDKNFLDYFSQTPAFHKNIAAKGSTNYAGIRPGQILDYSIPLPPLAEQRRLVAQLDATRAKLAEVRRLRTRQDADVKALLNKLFDGLLEKAPLAAVGDVLLPKRNYVNLNPNQVYKQVTVRMDHKGIHQRQTILGSEIGSIQLLANENDFIISKIDARNGAMGLVPAELDGAVVTNDFPLYSFSEHIRPGYFSFVTNTNYFDEACKKASEGTTNRKRLKTSRFEAILIPLPDLEKQDEILEMLTRLREVSAVHAHSETLLAQVMPALLAGVFGG